MCEVGVKIQSFTEKGSIRCSEGEMDREHVLGVVLEGAPKSIKFGQESVEEGVKIECFTEKGSIYHHWN